MNTRDVLVAARALLADPGLTWSSTFGYFGPYLLTAWRGTSGAFNNTLPACNAGTQPSGMKATVTSDDVPTSGDVVLTSTIGTIPATADDATAINRVYYKIGFQSENLSAGTITVSDVAAWIVP